MASGVLVQANVASTRQYLLATMARVSNMEPAYQLLKGPVLLAQRRWWANEGEGTWAPNTDLTKLRKENEGHPYLMIDSGRLKKAVTEGGKGHIWKTYPHALWFGLSSDVYWGQIGATLYKRSPLGLLNSKEMKMVSETLGTYVLTGKAALHG